MLVQPILLACLLTAAASIVGGVLPLCCRISHRWMQVLLSVVAGVMAGIAALDLLPHAIEALSSTAEQAHHGHHHGHHHGASDGVRTAMGHP